MKGIGGNLTAIIEKRTVTKNEIGEHIESWQEAIPAIRYFPPRCSNPRTYSLRIISRCRMT